MSQAPWESEKYQLSEKDLKDIQEAREAAIKAQLDWDRNYCKRKQLLMSPLPSDVFRARMAAGLTIADAARLVYISAQEWTRYERDTDKNAKRMPPQIAELFALKTGLKPLEPMKREYLLGKDGMTKLWVGKE